MKKHLFFALCCAALFNTASAQNNHPEHRKYATQLRLRQLQTTDPWVKDSMASVERFAAHFRQFGYMDTMSMTLVFHLMPLPDGTTRPDAADIQAQLDRLNTDFFAPEHPYLGETYQHPNLLFDTLGEITGTQADIQSYLHEADQKEGFAQRAGRPMIRFCPAIYDPNGLPTTGVVYPAGMPRTWGIGDSLYRAAFGGSEAWSPSRYCNIWIARLAGGYAGYAQLPGGPPETDGIVIDDRFFARVAPDMGNPYRSGKTLSHLMGSYLNLYELWNDASPCIDDFVDDTPIHNASNSGLPDYHYRHVSLCDGNPAEMITNLMDNSMDSLQYLFTWGQAMRMQATLTEGGPRSMLRHTSTICVDEMQAAPSESQRADSGSNANTNEEFVLRIFPNPASGSFMLEIQSNRESDAEVRILNIYGAIQYRQSQHLAAGVSQYRIDAAGWSPGFYTVIIAADDDKRAVGKILLER